MPLYFWATLFPPHHHLHLDLSILWNLTQGNKWKYTQTVGHPYNKMLVSHAKDMGEVQKQNPEEVKHKRMQHIWFRLSDILEEAKLREQKTGQWSSGAGRGEGTGHKRTGENLGGDENGLCRDGMQLYAFVKIIKPVCTPKKGEFHCIEIIP